MTEKIESTPLDRTGWAAGPWDTEPDRVEWYDESTGLPCLINRGPLGSLCGYVAVAPGHPWHGVDYNECTSPAVHEEQEYCYDHSPEAMVDVHGGLTYADRCSGSICHVPAPGEPADVWWFGFDCAHAWDITPRSSARFPPLHDEVYRDVAYVTAEVTRLAAQLSEVKGPK